MDRTADLRLLLASRHPLIVARLDDEPRFMEILRHAAELCGYPVWIWSLTHGLRRDGMGAQTGTTDARAALAFIAQVPGPGVFVMNDLHLLDDVVVRLLKEIAQANLPGQTVVLTGASADVPRELDGIALPWTLEPPSREEVEPIVRSTLDDLRRSGLGVVIDDRGMAELVDAVRGITLPEAQRLILRAAIADGRLDESDVEAIRNAKAELLATDGVLELVPADPAGLDAVGGLDGLKEWLRVRGKGFDPSAGHFGLEPPRGVLLLGVPGCGKSLVAKTVARTWHMPLVLLDPGAIYGSYVGESEARLRSALDTVEAMSPVVLWVDEIEKGFATGAAQGDAGVSQRVLGEFLHWLQERPAGVFLVATCNDVHALPPELLRRGRFDETFFVDLPNAEEREAIVRLHLSKRKRDPAAFDIAKLSSASDGLSGAEIEGAVVGAMYRAFAGGKDVTTEGILDEMAATAPLSRTRAGEIATLRAWAGGRARSATG